MKKSFLSALIIISFLACTKENTTEIKPEPDVPTSEFDALKQEVAELKSQIQNLTPGEQAPCISVEEFNALKQENEELKAQIALFDGKSWKIGQTPTNQPWKNGQKLLFSPGKNGRPMLTRKIDAVIDTFYDNTKMALMLTGARHLEAAAGEAQKEENVCIEMFDEKDIRQVCRNRSKY